MATSPLLTTAIPVYNEQDAILRCVFSVLSQYGDFDNEILIIDDGSTDNTMDVLVQLSKRFKNIRVLQNDRNQGRPFTRSRLLQEARGTYYAMLDADDAWFPEKLKLQMARIKEMGSADNIMVCGNLRFNDIEAKTTRNKDFAKGYAEYSMQRLLKGDNIPISQLCLANTGFLRRVGDFDGRLSRAQDWDFLIRFFSEGGTVAFVPGPPIAEFNFKRGGRNWREITACLEMVVAKHINLYEQFDVDADDALAIMRHNYVSEFKKKVQ